MPKIYDLSQSDTKETKRSKNCRRRQIKRRQPNASFKNGERHRSGQSSNNGAIDQKLKGKRYPLHRCDEKFQFERKKDAIKSADSYMDRVCMTFDPMVPYHCGHHSKWHTGHDTRYPKTRRVEYHAKCVKRERCRLAGG